PLATTPATGTPPQFLRYTPLEQLFNAANVQSQDPEARNDHVALWPTAVFPSADGGGAVVFYRKLVDLGGLVFEFQGTGLALVGAADPTAASRQLGEAGEAALLFQAPEPTFEIGRAHV